MGGTQPSTNKTVVSWSSGDSTEWKRMSQDSRSKSGRRMLTHHGHLWLWSSTPSNYVSVGFKLKKVIPPVLEVITRGVFRTKSWGMGPKRFVLSVDDDTEFRSRWEWIIPFFTTEISSEYFSKKFTTTKSGSRRCPTPPGWWVRKLCLEHYCLHLTVGLTTIRPKEFWTCVKSNVARGPGPTWVNQFTVSCPL